MGGFFIPWIMWLTCKGDEPLIPAINIQQVAENLTSITNKLKWLRGLSKLRDVEEAISSPNVVKVIPNKQVIALYLSCHILYESFPVLLDWRSDKTNRWIVIMLASQLAFNALPTRFVLNICQHVAIRLEANWIWTRNNTRFHGMVK